MSIGNPLADYIRKEAFDSAENLVKHFLVQFVRVKDIPHPHDVDDNHVFIMQINRMFRRHPRDVEAEALYIKYMLDPDEKIAQEACKKLKVILNSRYPLTLEEASDLCGKDRRNLHPIPFAGASDAARILYQLSAPAFEHAWDCNYTIEQCLRCDYPDVRDFVDKYRNQLMLAKQDLAIACHHESPINNV